MNIKKEKCIECEKPYEPDQYYFWCNECGEKAEEDWIEYVVQLSNQIKRNIK